MIRKMVQGLVAMPLVGLLLEIVGFREGGVIPENLLPLKVVFITMPSFFILSGILISRKFHITPDSHKILSDEISRLREGGDKDKAPREVRDVCEDLCGQPWDSLYGESSSGASQVR